MITRQPIIWATLLYVTGILLGNFFSSIYFLLTSVALLVACMLLRRKTYVSDILLYVFWISLGMARIGMEKESPSEYHCFDAVCQKAQQQQEALMVRLHNAGLEGKALSLSSALLIGDKSGLDKTTRRKYAQVGASHLLALSGMHLGILYGILYILFIRRIRSSRWKWFWLPPILLTIWGYAFIAGMPISLGRACIMFSLATIATFAQEETPPTHILALCALTILLFQPNALFGISFQLSFLAVLFILILYQPLKDMLKVRNAVLDMLLLSAVAQLATAPLAIYYFHSFPLLGSIVSIILIPLTTIIIYLGMLTLLVPTAFSVWLLTITVGIQNWIVDTVASIPHSTMTNLYPAWWQVLSFYLLLLCVTAKSHINRSLKDFSL